MCIVRVLERLRYVSLQGGTSNFMMLSLQGEKPDLPLKRSKSMKTTSKPVSVIPVLTSHDTSFTECRSVVVEAMWHPLKHTSIQLLYIVRGR